MTAREVILARVAAARVPAAPFERPSVEASCRDCEAIAARFAEHAAEYRANVVRVAPDALGETLEGLLEGRVLVSEDWSEAWAALYPPAPAALGRPEPLPRPASRKRKEGVTFVRDVGLPIAELDAADIALTLCAVAIAETGTVVLDHGPGQGRRAMTLVPDRHIVVVPAHRIVDSVPVAVAALGDAVRAGRPLTWISGPSATSDIELTRVEGVHGPRRLDIVVVA